MFAGIPKIIHYCWFGNNPKPELVLKCIESWKKYLPDYEIREWNDNDLKSCENRYVKEAYEAKKWAFISDYFRLYALYNYGGIYLDSDNEVFKSFDDFLDLEFFSGFDNWHGIVEPFTAVVGAQKHNKIIKDLLDEYNDIPFIKPDGEMDLTTNSVRVRNYFKSKYNLLPPYNGSEKVVLEKNCVLFPYNYFCLYEGDNTYAVHHFNASWCPKKSVSNILKFGDYRLYKQKVLNKNCNDLDLPACEKILFKLKLSPKKYIILSKILNTRKRILFISELAIRKNLNNGAYKYLNSVISELKKKYSVDYIALRQPRKLLNRFTAKNSPDYIYKAVRILGSNTFLNLDFNIPKIISNMPLPVQKLNWIKTILSKNKYYAVFVNMTNLCNVFDLPETSQIPYKVVLTNDIWHNRLEMFKNQNLDTSDIEYWTKDNEVKFWNKADIVAAIQEDEKAKIKSLCPDKIVVNLPVIYYRQLSYSEKVLSPEEKNIVCVSGASLVNCQGVEYFINNIFPLVLQKVPDAKLLVCGGVCNYFKEKEYKNVYFKGFVPDLKEIYKSAFCSVIPLLAGSGLKIKLVEALVHSTAVVTTSVGAQGVSGIDKFCGFISDNPEEFADDVVELINNRQLNKIYSQNALSFANAHFSGDAAMSELYDAMK